MKVLIKKPVGAHFSGSFPIQEAELTDKIIKEHKLEAGLKSFAARLAKQLKVPGIEIHNIGFTTIMDLPEQDQFDAHFVVEQERAHGKTRG